MKHVSRRALAFGALWVAIGGAAMLAPGCYGNNCLGGIAVYGADAGEGQMLDEKTWTTGPIEGDWLWFPRQRLYFFEIASLGGRTPQVISPYISTVSAPVKTGVALVNGAGNIALISGVGPNRVAVKNDTCSDYYLHLVVQTTPPAPETSAADAGIVDAASDDAAADASDAGP